MFLSFRDSCYGQLEVVRLIAENRNRKLVPGLVLYAVLNDPKPEFWIRAGDGHQFGGDFVVGIL